jgi:hypothetical protein
VGLIKKWRMMRRYAHAYRSEYYETGMRVIERASTRNVNFFLTGSEAEQAEIEARTKALTRSVSSLLDEEQQKPLITGLSFFLVLSRLDEIHEAVERAAGTANDDWKAFPMYRLARQTEMHKSLMGPAEKVLVHVAILFGEKSEIEQKELADRAETLADKICNLTDKESPVVASFSCLAAIRAFNRAAERVASKVKP